MPEPSPEIVRSVVQAEASLLDPSIRSDAGRLEQLLHPRFREIGQSGRLWSRDEILRAMVSGEAGVQAGLALERPQVDQIAPDVYVLTYLLASMRSTTRRSSIWDMSSGSLRIVFHQGTPLHSE